MYFLKRIFNAVMAWFGYVPKEQKPEKNVDENRGKGFEKKQNSDKPRVNKPQTFNIIDCDVISVEEVE